MNGNNAFEIKAKIAYIAEIETTNTKKLFTSHNPIKKSILSRIRDFSIFYQNFICYLATTTEAGLNNLPFKTYPNCITFIIEPTL